MDSTGKGYVFHVSACVFVSLRAWLTAVPSASVNAIDQSSTVPSGLDEHFQKSMTLQPPLTETIRLTSGVTLKEGEAVISGPAPPADSTHMSRRDFSVRYSVACDTFEKHLALHGCLWRVSPRPIKAR
jgi:hypothetical protein